VKLLTLPGQKIQITKKESHHDLNPQPIAYMMTTLVTLTTQLWRHITRGNPFQYNRVTTWTRTKMEIVWLSSGGGRWASWNDPEIPHPTWQTFSFLVWQALQTYYIVFMFSCLHAWMAQWLAWWYQYDDVSFRSRIQILIKTTFSPLHKDESVSIYPQRDVKIHYAPLNYLLGTIIVFKALYGVILCRSTWTCWNCIM